MKKDDLHSVYFIGIGGIGMSALARWFVARGKKVAGYDIGETELTKVLVSEGIDIHYEDDISLIPNNFKGQTGTLIVYTPAIPEKHSELKFFAENNFNLQKRAEVLGGLTKDHYTIAIAGTHGKTTTSSMVAHLLNGQTGGVNAFVGGIMTNYDTNLILGDEDAPIVVEADEFDRSFLHIHPNYTVVTSIDADHLDIYGNEDEISKSFLEFVERTAPKGRILMSSEAGLKIFGPAYISYDIRLGDIVAESLRIVDGAFVFTYRKGKIKITDLFLYVPGYHNVLNALAAVTVAFEMGMSDKLIRTRLKTYKGVKRRFEFVVRFGKTVVIDDYAHHPTEIAAILRSVRVLCKKRHITVVFQPHLFTRTRDFLEGFADSLDAADDIILLPIYPAREKPIRNITSESILEKMENENKMVCEKSELLDVLKEKKPDLILTLGAGDIDKEVTKIAEFFKPVESEEN
ncbi:MAG: UDP-N-acetylmuramate--L-alanine ligase [Cytophagales bacterium]|nr:UDP-N-acetylmuramate--L-alanine ligase [Cytophagales bacterium]